ncbi:MAG: hypothetical protein WC616_00900 [Candidatus Omnitrophota bacterium]
MIRKVIIFGLIVLAAFIFYKKFMSDTLHPFFGKIRRDKSKVDLFQQKAPEYKVNE